MKRGVEQAKLYRSLAEHAVQIQRMISRIVIVPIAVVAAVVPLGFHAVQRHRRSAVHLVKKPCVHLFAVTLTLNIDLQSFVQQIFFRCHNVDDIAKRLCRMRCGIDMHMNAARRIHPCTGSSQLSHKFLDSFDILIVTNRRNKLHSVKPARTPAVAVGTGQA